MWHKWGKLSLYSNVGNILKKKNKKISKKSVFVSKMQISIDFTDQSVDTFWTIFVKVDTK